MRWAALFALGLVALTAPRPCVAPLPPTPDYLKFATFSSHPKQCPPAMPAWVSHEWWWQDDESTGKAQPLGQSIQSGCYPYNQIIPRAGTYTVTSLQHKNPTILRDQQIRLRKLDGNFIRGMVTLPACVDNSLPDNGAVGCQYNLYRPNLTPQLCKYGKGVVAQTFTLAATDPSATRLQCRYADSTPYDTRTAPASGNVQLNVLNNYLAYPNMVQQYKRTGDPYTISDKALRGKTIQLTSMLPVAIPDRDNYPCGTGTSCNWSEDDVFQIGTQTWMGERTLMAKGGPFFLIPVGGTWRMRLSATLYENQVGRTVNQRNLVIFDADIRNGITGTVFRNDTGGMDGEEVVLDLSPGGDLTPGWHKVTIQSRATDLYSRAVDTASMTTYLEVAPTCPTSGVPFATHVTSEEMGKISVRDGVWTRATPKTPSFILQSSRPTDYAFYWTLKFDLSFLSTSVSLDKASLYIYLVAANTDSRALPSMFMDVYDGSMKFGAGCQASCEAGTNGVSCFKCPPSSDILESAPCIGPICSGNKVGTVAFQGSDAKLLLKMTLSNAYVSKFVGAGKGLMPLTVVMPPQRQAILDGASLQSLIGVSPAFIVMQGSCL